MVIAIVASNFFKILQVAKIAPIIRKFKSYMSKKKFNKEFKRRRKQMINIRNLYHGFKLKKLANMNKKRG